VLEFPVNELGLHPTAKPVGLLEFLIETYTRPGEIVLDPTMGMDSTGIAAANTGRRFVGIEKDATFIPDRSRTARHLTTGFRLMGSLSRSRQISSARTGSGVKAETAAQGQEGQ
jgi:hypothetical protein